jgi:polar amino acid transport system substrate-binding protein
MGLQATCTIQVVPFDELIEALNSGRGDAIISGLIANEKTRADFVFSKSYLRFPGRFVKLRTNSDAFNFDEGLIGQKIGTVSGSGQEKLIRSYFPEATIIGFATEQLLASDLIAGKLDLLFGDGMSLSFWLNGNASKACCTFVGSPYYAQIVLGEGMRIAAMNSRPEVILAINKSLEAIQKKQGFDEFFLRFFPYNFF